MQPIISLLGEIADFINGGAWSQSEYSEHGVRVVRVTDIQGETIDLSACKHLPATLLSKYIRHRLKKDDLVVCTVGSHPTQPGSVVGRTIIVPEAAEGALLNQNAVSVRVRIPEVDQRWLGYLGRSADFHDYIIGCARGSANQVRMAIGLLKEMPIKYPPLREQKRIAKTLSAYDEMIENNQRRIRILEEMARSLYREWFVHFRFPGHENHSLVPSALGKIPQGWAVKRLGETLQLMYGKALKAESRNGGVVPVYGSSGVVGYHDEALSDGPGIIVGRKGNIGSIAWSDANFFVIDTAFYVRSTLPMRFLFHALQGKQFLNSDAAVPGLNREQAYGLNQIVPPTELVEEFSQKAEVIGQQATTLANKSVNLRKTRDLLLPRLLSGQIKLEAH